MDRRTSGQFGQLSCISAVTRYSDRCPVEFRQLTWEVPGRVRHTAGGAESTLRWLGHRTNCGYHVGTTNTGSPDWYRVLLSFVFHDLEGNIMKTTRKLALATTAGLGAWIGSGGAFSTVLASIFMV